MNHFNHTIDGKPRSVFRLTHKSLGGHHGKYKDRPLVVGLEAGDVISFRPKGTRFTVRAHAVSVYDWVILCQTLNEKARQKAGKKSKKKSS